VSAGGLGDAKIGVNIESLLLVPFCLNNVASGLVRDS